jgi:hypothetical protein
MMVSDLSEKIATHGQDINLSEVYSLVGARVRVEDCEPRSITNKKQILAVLGLVSSCNPFGDCRSFADFFALIF